MKVLFRVSRKRPAWDSQSRVSQQYKVQKSGSGCDTVQHCVTLFNKMQFQRTKLSQNNMWHFVFALCAFDTPVVWLYVTVMSISIIQWRKVQSGKTALLHLGEFADLRVQKASPLWDTSLFHISTRLLKQKKWDTKDEFWDKKGMTHDTGPL